MLTNLNHKHNGSKIANNMKLKFLTIMCPLKKVRFLSWFCLCWKNPPLSYESSMLQFIL